MWVKCLAQEHNTVSPARARTRTARSGDEYTNHEATAPPYNNNWFYLRVNVCSALALIGNTFQARIGIWKGWFLRRGENGSTWRKTSRSREENQQQTQPTYDARSNPGHTGAILLQCLNGGRTVPRLKHQKRSKVIAIPVLSRNHSFTPYTVSACRSNTSTAYSAVITFWFSCSLDLHKNQKIKLLYLSVNVFSALALIEDTFPS